MFSYFEYYNNSNISRNQRIEPKFFDWDTEFTEFTFVGLDHVGVRLSDLFERSLDLSDGIGFEVFDLLESGPDYTKSLWVNSCGCQELVDLGILGLEGLLNGLMLFLQDQVSDTRLLVDLIDKSMELFEQLLLLDFEVLELLKSDFILPFDLL